MPVMGCQIPRVCWVARSQSGGGSSGRIPVAWSRPYLPLRRPDAKNSVAKNWNSTTMMIGAAWRRTVLICAFFLSSGAFVIFLLSRFCLCQHQTDKLTDALNTKSMNGPPRPVPFDTFRSRESQNFDRLRATTILWRVLTISRNFDYLLHPRRFCSNFSWRSQKFESWRTN